MRISKIDIDGPSDGLADGLTVGASVSQSRTSPMHRLQIPHESGQGRLSHVSKPNAASDLAFVHDPFSINSEVQEFRYTSQFCRSNGSRVGNAVGIVDGLSVISIALEGFALGSFDGEIVGFFVGSEVGSG